MFRKDENDIPDKTYLWILLILSTYIVLSTCNSNGIE